MRHVALLAAFVVLLSAVTGPTVAVVAATQSAPATAHGPDAALSPPEAGPASVADPGPEVEQVGALAVGAPTTNFTVELRSDASARWTVETRIPLETETDRSAFREYARAYEDGTADGGPSAVLFRNAAEAASEATGREMSVGQVNRTATLANGSGTLALRFTWSGFLATGENGTLVLGDAFATPGNGTWLGSLSASQQLVVVPPANYEVSDVSDGFRRSISDRRIVVEGPQTFSQGDVRIAYSPVGGSEFPLAWVVGGGAVLLVVVAVVAYRRGGLRAEVPGLPTPASEPDGGADPATADAGDAPSNGADDPGPTTPTVGADAGGAAAATESGSTAASADGASEEDLELLSDEERVERLLERNGGRMRQGDIVSGTGWSDAKVSQAAVGDGRRGPHREAPTRPREPDLAGRRGGRRRRRRPPGTDPAAEPLPRARRASPPAVPKPFTPAPGKVCAMKILVTVKEVAEAADDFAIDGTDIGEQYLEYDLNEWDDYAVEAAVQLSEAHDDVETVSVTIGPERSEETIRMALAKGVDRAIRVWDDDVAAADLDVAAKTRLLAAVVADEEPDLVLTGVQAADDGFGATGVSLADEIGFDWAAVVNTLETADDLSMAHVHRELEGGVEELTDVDFPAVLTVQTGLNEPRYASLRGIRQAQSKEIAEYGLGDLGLDAGAVASPIERTAMYEPETESDATYFDGPAEEQAAQLADVLRNKGVVSE